MFIQAAVHNNMMPGVKKTPPVWVGLKTSI
jgi:hypothetical protein